MVEQTTEQVPLVCTPEVSKAIYDELTLRGLVEGGQELVVGGAGWQKNRIVKHLKEKLAELQAQLAKMDEAASKRAASIRHPEQMDDLGTVKSYIRGKLEGQIELSQKLIASLQ